MEEKKEEGKKIEFSDKNFFIFSAIIAFVCVLVPVAMARHYDGPSSATRVVHQDEDIKDIVDDSTGGTASASLDNLMPVDESDHILGNIDAAVKIISYSDSLCPFCQRFHETMQDVISDYEPGQVAWVYRHLPIIGGENSIDLARASECVAEQGGNEAFFRFTDLVYAGVGENQLSGKDYAREIAGKMSLVLSDFNTCLDSGKFDDKIDAQTEGGFAIGASGTPHSVVLFADGTKYEINGAQSAETVRSIIKVGLEK